MPRFLQQGDYYRIYVHYIDNYGNAYLGMTYREFEELRAGRDFVLTVRDEEVKELMLSYHQQHANSDPSRKLRLTVSATGFLELAVKESSLAQLVGLRVNESVLLKFKS
jgi:S-adenosylmethionine hydrolase